MGDNAKPAAATRSAAATRESILCAARRQFSRESYENVGLRGIAGEVGVDAALVIRYFGSKEALFRELLSGGKEASPWEGRTIGELPAVLASLVMDGGPGPDGEDIHLDRLLIILRSASSVQASAIVYDAIDDFIIEPLTGLLGDEDAQLKACLALSVLMGSSIVRQIMRSRPICDAKECTVRQSMTDLFAAALGLTEWQSSPL